MHGCRAARGSRAADQLLVVIETKLGFFSSINAKQPAVSTRGDFLLHQLVERDRQVTHAFSRGVEHGVGDRGAHASDADLADAPRATGA